MTGAPSLFPAALPAPSEGADVAYTPDRVARALTHTLAYEIVDQPVWEPYVGGGAFARALGPLPSHLLVTDCDPAAEGLNTHGRPFSRSAVHDVARGIPDGWPRPAWIVSNPPFSLLFGDETGAGGHLRVLLDTATHGVALLLVGQCLAPAKRDWIWDTAVPDWRLDIRERIAFEGPGRDGKSTDMREYAWFVWRKRGESWMGRGKMGRVSTETGRVWMPGGVS